MKTNQTRRPRGHQRTDDANAFFPDPGDGRAMVDDPLAEEFAEDFLRSATSGEDQGQRLTDATVSEEIGGPFVETDDIDEMAAGSDASNPPDAGREPLPRAVAGLVATPPIGAPGADDSGDDDDDVDLDGGPPTLSTRRR